MARAAGADPVRVHVLTGQDGAPAVAGFTFGAQAITARLTAGEYPNMAAMIPAQFAAAAVLDTGELAEAVKRLAVVAARDTPIHLAFGPGQVELRAGSADEADGTDAVELRAGRRPAHGRVPPPPPAGRPHRCRHRPGPHRPDRPGAKPP